MPTDPIDNISLQIPALPLDEDRNKVAALFSAIVSGGDIVGYLPVKSTDNLDGTATPHVRIDGIVFDPNIDIGDVHLLNIANAKIDPATEQKQDDIITAIGTIAAVDPVGLKNIGGSTIDPATEQKQDSLISQLTTQVRALFDSIGNAITSTLISAKRGVDVFIINDEATPVIVEGTQGNLAAKGQMYVFASPQLNFTPSGTEHPFVLIRNPAASGKQIRIRSVTQSIVSTNKPTTFRGYFNPTVTANGVVETPINKLSNSVNPTIALVNTLPTISANGARINADVPVAGVFVVDPQFTIIIASGDSLLITVQPTVNNTEVNVTVDWSEVTP